MVREKFNICVINGHNITDYIELTKKYRFSFIFCDLNLDYKKEGLDIVKLHKKRKLKSKIVAFTSENYTLEMIQKSGFDYLLNKDFDKVEKFFEFYVIAKESNKNSLIKNRSNINLRS